MIRDGHGLGQSVGWVALGWIRFLGRIAVLRTYEAYCYRQ